MWKGYARFCDMVEIIMLQKAAESKKWKPTRCEHFMG